MASILDALDSVTRSMPRFEGYMRLYPERGPLRRALYNIYCHFLDFCVDTVRFLRHGLFSELHLGILLYPQLAFHEKNALGCHAHCQPICGSAVTRRAFSVPRARNTRFFGRTVELNQLKDNLAPDPHQQRSCVLHGMTGVGKSQVALQFCYTRRNDFAHIIWVEAEDEMRLAETFSKIPHKAGSASIHHTSAILSHIEAAQDWLAEHQSWLLVFDNADSAILLKRYWPKCLHGSILVTTQNRSLAHCDWITSEVPLELLNDDDGAGLLLKHLPMKKPGRATTSPNDDMKTARKISQAVSGLPLLLAHIAGCVADGDILLEDALQGLNRSWSEEGHVFDILTPETAVSRSERNVNRGFNVALHLNKLPPAAMAVLRIMSLFSAHCIPQELLSEDSQELKLSFLRITNTVQFCREIRVPLVSRHLVEFHGPVEDGTAFYWIHPLLQEKVLRDMKRSPALLQQTFDQAVALLTRVLPEFPELMVPAIDQWPLHQRYAPHVQRLEEVFSRLESLHRHHSPKSRFEFAKLLVGTGYYLYEARLAKTGLRILKTGGSICEQLRSATPRVRWFFGPKGTKERVSVTRQDIAKFEAASLQISWAIIANTQGLKGRQKAMECMTEVLQLRKDYAARSCGSEDSFLGQVLLANAHNDMACQLIDAGMYSEAEGHIALSETIKQGLQQDLPPFEYAEPMKNLAIIKLGQGKVDEGLQLSRRASDMLRKDGPDDAAYTNFRFIYGTCLMSAGRVAEALAVFEEDCRLCRQIFGDTSAYTRNNLYAKALALYQMGQLKEARSTITNCIGDPDDSFWPRECIIRAEYLHSLILEALDEPEQAMGLKRAALDQLGDLLVFSSPPGINADTTKLHDMKKEGLAFLVDHAVHFEAGRFTLHQ
ncbi:hypothetical protein QBC47DRAFT_353907 [Echria macrotheca]|uniref:NB-ARC domain-containing protein n=1 Tax=Echria macrotheca TaxID=438768 RepID=A0AAJ0B489_9PEZI|nr:hypothetical protein QBC47DRAFT_353907 [Echria macrotheca]